MISLLINILSICCIQDLLVNASTNSELTKTAAQVSDTREKDVQDTPSNLFYNKELFSNITKLFNVIFNNRNETSKLNRNSTIFNHKNIMKFLKDVEMALPPSSTDIFANITHYFKGMPTGISHNLNLVNFGSNGASFINIPKPTSLLDRLNNNNLIINRDLFQNASTLYDNIENTDTPSLRTWINSDNNENNHHQIFSKWFNESTHGDLLTLTATFKQQTNQSNNVESHNTTDSFNDILQKFNVSNSAGNSIVWVDGAGNRSLEANTLKTLADFLRNSSNQFNNEGVVKMKPLNLTQWLNENRQQVNGTNLDGNSTLWINGVTNGPSNENIIKILEDLLQSSGNQSNNERLVSIEPLNLTDWLNENHQQFNATNLFGNTTVWVSGATNGPLDRNMLTIVDALLKRSNNQSTNATLENMGPLNLTDWLNGNHQELNLKNLDGNTTIWVNGGGNRSFEANTLKTLADFLRNSSNQFNNEGVVKMKPLNLTQWLNENRQQVNGTNLDGNSTLWINGATNGPSNENIIKILEDLLQSSSNQSNNERLVSIKPLNLTDWLNENHQQFNATNIFGNTTVWVNGATNGPLDGNMLTIVDTLLKRSSNQSNNASLANMVPLNLTDWLNDNHQELHLTNLDGNTTIWVKGAKNGPSDGNMLKILEDLLKRYSNQSNQGGLINMKPLNVNDWLDNNHQQLNFTNLHGNTSIWVNGGTNGPLDGNLLKILEDLLKKPSNQSNSIELLNTESPNFADWLKKNHKKFDFPNFVGSETNEDSIIFEALKKNLLNKSHSDGFVNSKVGNIANGAEGLESSGLKTSMVSTNSLDKHTKPHVNMGSIGFINDDGQIFNFDDRAKQTKHAEKRETRKMIEKRNARIENQQLTRSKRDGNAEGELSGSAETVSIADATTTTEAATTTEETTTEEVTTTEETTTEAATTTEETTTESTEATTAATKATTTSRRRRRRKRCKDGWIRKIFKYLASLVPTFIDSLCFGIFCRYASRCLNV